MALRLITVAGLVKARVKLRVNINPESPSTGTSNDDSLSVWMPEVRVRLLK